MNVNLSEASCDNLRSINKNCGCRGDSHSLAADADADEAAR